MTCVQDIRGRRAAFDLWIGGCCRRRKCRRPRMLFANLGAYQGELPAYLGGTMNVLIAEDEPVLRRSLQLMLQDWGYGVVVTEDGNGAWEALRRDGGPQLAVLDWMMPGLDGPEVCRRLKQSPRPRLREPYVVLLTARDAKADVVAGLESGADDYIAKPYDIDELRARLRV